MDSITSHETIERPLSEVTSLPATPRLHFISGLPRSGSTLLTALLRQNPRFHARINSPVSRLFRLMLVGMNEEAGFFLGDEQRHRMLHALFESYYAQIDRAVAFNSSRGWTAQLPALLRIFPEAKVVCTVRNVAWVMDSIERLIRANPLIVSKLFTNEDERANVYSRTETLAARQRLVGGAWSNLKEAFYGEQANHLLLVDYEFLARAPAKTLGLIYDFLGEEHFAHDFDNIEYDEPEFDAALATPGLHRVERRVQFTPRRTILPPDLFERFGKLSFWTSPAPSVANRIGPAPDPAPSGTTEGGTQWPITSSPI